ncbi:toprim domain-containing protein [Candidatus Agathobaculum pullicola]|uniref:toprim domain-containing protein n=1 Tax=Candidatus Agathobaculum pullicola TaxID=2838426 RepID=UPI003F90DA53
MIRVREAIVVEGRYDANTVRQVVDAVVLESGGFRIFHDKDQLRLLRKIASSRGLIVLTDSDGAGFVIRNYIKGALPSGSVKQAYIPDVTGKERRKRHGSKEGKLGVEGMRPEVILEALRRAGATFEEQTNSSTRDKKIISKADFFAWGLSGQPNSVKRRTEVLKALDLPSHMTANALLEFINAVSSREEMEEIIKRISVGG